MSVSDGGRAMPRGARIAQSAAVSAICFALLTLTVLQYALPDSSRYPGPIDRPGLHQFARSMLGAVPAHVPVGSFVVAFEVLVVLAWAAYAVLIYTGLRWRVARPARIILTAGLLAVALALFFPTSLTHDLYAYLGYGRMEPLYGLNPYRVGLEALSRRGDLAALLYPTPRPSVYGPFWTLLSSGLALSLKAASLATQAISLKLLQAAALIGGAFAARALAARRDPAHADLSLVAFALNPLLLLEGPGNGHNDLLMVALLVAGLALAEHGRWRLGYLVLGLSVAVKFVSLAAVPLLLIQQTAEMPWRQRIAHAAGATGLTAAPVALAFVPFASAGNVLAPITGLAGSRASADGSGGTMRVALVFVLYLMALVWLAFDSKRGLATQWTLWSALTIQFAFPGTLPWYFMWPTGVTLTQWDRRQLVISIGVMALSIRWMLYYVHLRGG